MYGALEVVLPDGDRGERLEVVGDAWFVPGLGRLRHPFLQAFRRAGQVALCLAAERQVVERDEDGEPVLRAPGRVQGLGRSEEHTSELQSHVNLVCRLLLEKKNKDPRKNSTKLTIY